MLELASVSWANGGKLWDLICRGSLSMGSKKMRCTRLSIWRPPTKHPTRMIWEPATCLWRAQLSSPGGALYSRSTPWSWTRLWGRARRGLRGCRLDPDVSRVWSWSTRWSHTQASGKMAASLGKFDMTPVKDADIWRFAGTCLLHSETFAPSQWTSSEPRMHAANQAIGAWTISSMCRLTQRLRSLGTATTAQLRTTSSKICGRLYQPMGTF